MAKLNLDQFRIDKEEKSVKAKQTITRHIKRRVTSELNLEQELPWHFEKGVSYHAISHGDVDSLTYLRMIVKQQKVKYMMLSTWCMALTDIKEIEKWIEKGYIERIDFYLGEIFQNSYKAEWIYLFNMCKKYNFRICICRNHSKVMSIFGEKFDCVIESSANVKTNPRIEQTCITLDTELARFYKDFFDDLVSFNKDFESWKKTEI